MPGEDEKRAPLAHAPQTARPLPTGRAYRARPVWHTIGRMYAVSGHSGLIVHAVGARPNFVKMAPLIEALEQRGATRQLVVHTGQHYDRRMSDEILEDLGFRAPDHSLGVGSGSHGDQTGKVLIGFEEIILGQRPDLVVVAGDVNSTLACALAAAKLGIPVAHLEAGLRSGDWTMPEEINRVLTDRLSDLLLTHSPEAEPNLAAEGIDIGRVRYVGNTMIDSLRRFEAKARQRARWRDYGVATAPRTSTNRLASRRSRARSARSPSADPSCSRCTPARAHGSTTAPGPTASRALACTAWTPWATSTSYRSRPAPAPS
jgi:UDP-N-acetylglucosamine 2-epimerase